MSRYANGTSVPVERSRAEIERVLMRYKATEFGTYHEPSRATVVFTVHGRQVQLPIPMPDPAKAPKSRSGWRLTGSALDRWMDQERRRRWRVLLLTVKALLEAVESKLMTFDEAFLAYVIIPGRAQTIGEYLAPRLDAMYSGEGLLALTSGADDPA